MYTARELKTFGNYLLSDERKKGIMTNQLLTDEERQKLLTSVSDSDILGWKASTPKIPKTEKDRSITHFLDRVEDGYPLYFEHRGINLTTQQSVAIFTAAKNGGYVYIDQIPEEFIDKILNI